MERIAFHKVVPDIFSQRNDLMSDIWNQDVVFEKGRLYLVEADSGKGKSTFCSYVLGYRHDYSGGIMFDSISTSSLTVADWVRIRERQVSCLFQYKTRRQILEWFDMLGISDKLDVKIGHMSFGQQQRVAMMRALAQPFDFILADEPISHLDDTNSDTMGRLMMNEAKSQGAAVIVTSIGKHMDLEYDKVFRL